MLINANTRLSVILKERPDALEAIVSISPKFQKLRNPILRKIMASRTTIQMAASIGNCRVEDFYLQLSAFGFQSVNNDSTNEPTEFRPLYMQSIGNYEIIDFDVRPILEQGNDPLKLIMNKIKELPSTRILRIINSFIPTPLMKLLSDKGFESYAERVKEDVFHIYIHQTEKATPLIVKENQETIESWDNVWAKFQDNLVEIDVRNLEMPSPMEAILHALQTLEKGKALFVYHKRVPMYLLPELAEMNFRVAINKLSESDLRLLIYK